MKNGTKVAAIALVLILGSAAFLYRQIQIEMAVMDCQSERSLEAPDILTRIAKAEQAYFAAHGRYTSDLLALDGLDLGVSHHVAGFASPSPPAEGTDPARRHTLVPEVAAKNGKPNLVHLDASALPANAVVRSDGFLAAAVGDFDDDAAVNLATIDETLRVVLVSDDCRSR